jgi:hypothetical protein
MRPNLLKRRSMAMEAERRAKGLDTFRFRYYTCPSCGYDDVFLDVVALPGESPEDLHRRTRDLERLARKLHADRTEVIVSEVSSL